MKKHLIDLEILNEEKRIVKWFLLMFYLIIPTYDFYYYYIVPRFIERTSVGFPNVYSYFTYLVIFCLAPVAIYLIKSKKQNLIKYIYTVSYMVATFLVDALTYYGSGNPYKSGNIIEVFFILFSPLFINTRFSGVVAIVILLKYSLLGIMLKTSIVILPLILVCIISFLSFILLKRFQGYVRTIQYAYEKQLNEIVKGIIATLELKDPYTKGHSERVAAYAVELAKLTEKFTKEELQSFSYACLLHDIGKINIPDQILMKPAKLTKDEFDVIKTHPVVGVEVIKNIEGFEDNIDVIRSHHERWDGKGYPDQLKKEEIPFLARITSIADAFDAMTSSRSYRDALPVEEAYKRIMESMGTQFDPNLAEDFKKAFPIWAQFHNLYPWQKQNNVKKEVR